MESQTNWPNAFMRISKQNTLHNVKLQFLRPDEMQKRWGQSSLRNHEMDVRSEEEKFFSSFIYNKTYLLSTPSYKKKANRKWNCASSDPWTIIEVDFIFCKRKDIFQDINVLNRFSTASDYRLFRAQVKINIKRQSENWSF